MSLSTTRPGSDPTGDQPALSRRAAQYVRMSTEHQQYSTENQEAAIRSYAEARNFVVIPTYADEGKSGLSRTLKKSFTFGDEG
jgi:DNA invertase Pin-like site-specific DNA recombinase